MSDQRLPPHLQIAESVTEDEYRRSLWQSKIVLTAALSAGTIVSIPLILMYGIWIGIPAAGVVAVLIERSLHRVFKDAHKAKTERMKRYKELKAFRERSPTQVPADQQQSADKTP